MDFMKSLLALVAVLSVLVGAIWALVTFVGLQASLVWAALVGGVAWLVRSEIEKKRELTKLLAEQKRQQYLQFLDFMVQYLGRSDEEADAEAARLLPGPQKYREWSMRLTLVGSDEVVTAWNAVRALGDGGLSDASLTEDEKRKRLVQMMRAWGKLLIEMRKDSGHPDTKLAKSDVFATFVNDMGIYRALVDASERSDEDDRARQAG